MVSGSYHAEISECYRSFVVLDQRTLCGEHGTLNGCEIMLARYGIDSDDFSEGFDYIASVSAEIVNTAQKMGYNMASFTSSVWAAGFFAGVIWEQARRETEMELA